MFSGHYKYTSLEYEGKFIHEVIPFGEYLRFILENTTFTTYGRGGYHKFEKVGWFGYLLAAREFAGFLIGGFVAYAALRSKVICPSCNLYMRKLKEVQHTFNDIDSAGSYLLAWEKEPLTNQRISTLLVGNTIEGELDANSVRVTTTLQGCPLCKNRRLDHDLAVYIEKEWKSISNLSGGFELECCDNSLFHPSSTEDRMSQTEKNESSG
jgi:hypothetical protein